jgi:hypothetical protein
VHTVREVSPRAIVEVVTRKGVQVSEATFTADTSAVYRARGALLEVAPFITAFREPRPGERWQVPVRGLVTVDFEGEPLYRVRQARVAGVERVQVPAGSFEAIRVDVEGSVSARHLYPGWGKRYRRGQETSFQQTVWYAPRAKRIVRLLMQADGVKTAYELESYALR